MAKSILFFLLLFVANSIALSQNTVTDSTATVIGYWNKGDKIRLSLTQSREKYKAGQLTLRASSTSIIDVSIIDATEKSYTVKWKYVDINASVKTNSPLADKISKISIGLEIIYKTDEMGTFAELVNWKEIQGFMDKTLEILKKEYDDPSADVAIREIRKMYSSKETIEQVVIKEVQLYHFLYGGEYKLKEKLSMDTQLPNVLGGEPFPAFIEVEMQSLIPSKNLCTITMEQKLDNEKTTKIIQDWIKKLPKKGEENPKIPNISVNDKSEFEVELLTGWIKKVTSVRTAFAEEEKQINSIEITLIQ